MFSFISFLSMLEYYCFYSENLTLLEKRLILLEENACAIHTFHCGKNKLMLLSNYLVCTIETVPPNFVINTTYKREEIKLYMFMLCFETAVKMIF